MRDMATLAPPVPRPPRSRHECCCQAEGASLQSRSRCQGVEGRVRPLRHLEGGLRRLPRGCRAHRPVGGGVLVARRRCRHAQEVVHRQPGRLRPDRHHRAGRHERHGSVRTALQLHAGYRAAHRVLRARTMVRSPPADRHRPGFRDRPAADTCQPARDASGTEPVRGSAGGEAGRVDDGLREGGCQRHRRQAGGSTCPPGATARSAS